MAAIERRELSGNYRYWIPVVAWLGLIFFVSSLPNPAGNLKVFKYQDKAAPFLEFGILGLLMVRGVFLSASRRLLFYWLCILGAALYGFGDEFHQMFVPNRTPEIKDALADSLGALVFAWGYLKLKGQSLWSAGSVKRT